MARKGFKIGVGFKITALVLTVVLISVISVSYIAFSLSSRSIEDRYQESIEVVSRLKTQKIETFFEKIKSAVNLGSELGAVKDKCLSVKNVNNTSQDTIRILPIDNKIDNKKVKKDSITKIEKIIPISNSKEEELNNVMKNMRASNNIKNIYLTLPNGTIIYAQGESANEVKKGALFQEKDGNTLAIAKDSTYFSNIFKQNSESLMHIASPIRDDKKNLLGILIYETRMQYVLDLVRDSTGLGNTGEIILTKSFGNQVVYLNQPRLDKNSDRSKVVYMGTINEKSIQNSVKDQKELYPFLDDIDYRKEKVLATWHYIGLVDWGIVVKIDKSEIYAPTYTLRNNLLLAGFAVFLISVLIGIIFSRQSLVSPLLTLKDTVDYLAQGVLPDKPKNNRGSDEIGEMGYKLDELVENLKVKAKFARDIGKGDLKADFRPASQNDSLGTALLTMRNSISSSQERDEERTWIVEGLAEIGDILPSITKLEELGDLVCEFVTKKIDAVQGAFYVVNDSDASNLVLEMNASYAYNKKKYLKNTFKFAEGLVGQAAMEKDIIVRTEIPDNYITISSGILGDKKPKCILVAPLITNENVYGVVEFAGFEKFEHREVEFIREISELIARTVFNIKVNQRTSILLEESQKLTSELQLQQEVLRQNAEIMEATQVELERTNLELQSQIQEVQKATDRTRLLLENASEVITIYEPNGTIRYISPSVEKILGYTQEEMTGIRDVTHIHPEGKSTFEEMFKDLLANPDEKITVQFSYFIKNGDRIWLEATGINLLSDSAIQGIIVNSRNITERRAAEKEQRLRGQMQALSENSPDLITRITKDGKVFYINPIIKDYTGKGVDEYLQRDLDQLELNEDPSKNTIILNAWQDILSEVRMRNTKTTSEMNFPSEMGDRVMQVNAIPEYNDQQVMESVLVVSHDITERKTIENELSVKNKKITDSINYAKRIQEAILPDTAYVRQYIPDSFMIYKPRDVVSGDFPWFYQDGENVYIAAVDCTGHGVPGALMSLIGFFLLNNIVNMQEGASPGEILDKLDSEVTRTLKQDGDDSSSRDGMDIAFCKINYKKRQIEYASAHRPLYYFNDGHLYEIKGNKFPVGGAQYNNHMRFTNTIINYQEGDSVYVFSDGFPDQFGGNKNKKFSPRKIRDIITEFAPKGMPAVQDKLDTEFEDWKGANKQTDDVLLIGIKL
ncbi:MAG: PAS domain S-box protein [Bacteroidetes bacterium]|nr:MAG: PAS domain S-box protein [Bacteroidota bacterium]TAG87110.1 MAG: PAS domain S-box protein [Bacteroidota bacterium]